METVAPTGIDWTKVDQPRRLLVMQVLSITQEQQYCSWARLAASVGLESRLAPAIVKSVNAFGRTHELGRLIKASHATSQEHFQLTEDGQRLLAELLSLTGRR